MQRITHCIPMRRMGTRRTGQAGLFHKIVIFESLKKYLDYIRLCGYINLMNTTAHHFKALSEPVRLRILALLTDGEHCVCDLMAVLDLPQSTVSRHLGALRHGGWVEGRRQGLWMYYRLTGDTSPIQKQALELLRRELVTLPQGRADQEKLAAFLAVKNTVACK